ncbi:hypothetical protein DPMN_155733 [Dreissena polymorpha]|uniref:Uncharacterized protein n=1 Tax=Dreissena polymorpha TaxID=45954 RepID=A0A9D4FT41_DREPO|nr:hypothetical protein DPMN_155733 [Dreissena polymorpha]
MLTCWDPPCPVGPGTRGQLDLLHNGQVVSKGTQTGLELLMVQLARLVLVKMPATTNTQSVNVQNTTM